MLHLLMVEIWKCLHYVRSGLSLIIHNSNFPLMYTVKRNKCESFLRRFCFTPQYNTAVHINWKTVFLWYKKTIILQLFKGLKTTQQTNKPSNTQISMIPVALGHQFCTTVHTWPIRGPIASTLPNFAVFLSVSVLSTDSFTLAERCCCRIDLFSSRKVSVG